MLLYFFFIMLDFIVPEVVYTAGDSKVTGEWKHFTIVWQRAFWCNPHRSPSPSPHPQRLTRHRESDI